MDGMLDLAQFALCAVTGCLLTVLVAIVVEWLCPQRPSEASEEEDFDGQADE